MSTFEYKVESSDTLQLGDSDNTITIPGDFTVTGTATFSGAVSSAGGISLGAGDDLIGSSTSDITFNTNKFTVAGATGNTVVAGTLDVGGDLTVGTGATLEVTDDGGLSINSTAVTSTAAELNILDDATVTTTELNRLDDSAEIETIDSGVAASTTKFNTLIDNTTTGAGAITLDVCPATMVGKLKTIRMAVDNGDVTLSLANIVGGTAATTATFDAVDEELVLMGSSSGKWIVIKEFGVTLS